MKNILTILICFASIHAFGQSKDADEIKIDQAGYLFGREFQGESGTSLMPYLSVMRANFDRLSDSMNVWSVGINYLMKDHRGKISLDGQIRPTFTSENGERLSNNGHKNQITMQYQIFI